MISGPRLQPSRHENQYADPIHSPRHPCTQRSPHIEVSVPDSINSALLHPPAWIMSMLFLIVHHPGGFPLAQHKAVCILLLKAVCGRPSLLTILVRSASLFARPPHAYTGLLKVFHLLYSIRLFCSQKPVQDTHGPVVGLVAVCVSRWRVFCQSR